MNVAQSAEPFCQNCNTDREMIIGFLKDYVIDKKLVSDEVVYQLEEGKLKGFIPMKCFFQI